MIRHFILVPFSDLCSSFSSSRVFSFHLPLYTFISQLSPSHPNSFPFHFMFSVIFYFSLHFPSQSIILFPSTLLSIPLSFRLLPFQFSRHLRLLLPNFPTPTCSLTFIYSNSSSPSFPLTFALSSHFIHSFPHLLHIAFASASLCS
jgi:hypothetical protein